MKETVLTLKNIEKTFPGVHALKGVSIDFLEGEVHGIVGENGAGKSTLMKILSGVYSLDTGEIYIKGKPVHINNAQDALNYGQSIIFQEFSLIDKLNIAENIFLGRLSNKNGTWIDWNQIKEKTILLLNQVGLSANPETLVKDLSVAQKQMVEIAKALSYNASLIIMDEPSATLTSKEVDGLFEIIRSLREKKITIIYISHKLEEIFKICDRVTVMRDGMVINTYLPEEVTENQLIQDMVGRSVSEEYPKKINIAGSEAQIVLETRSLCLEGVYSDINFSVKKGEILGFAGLVGAGRTEVMRGVFGADKIDRGEVIINGHKTVSHTPKESIKYGLSFLPEDRKQQGLFLQIALEENISVVNLKKILKYGFIRKKEEKKAADWFIGEMSIKTPSSRQKAVFLSGGNQQKVVLAKWLFANSNILILDEPTRGIDVGAKREIYNLINQMAEQGKSIILISSDLPELLGMSDRVLVMNEGKIKGELSGAQMTAENVMKVILEKQE